MRRRRRKRRVFSCNLQVSLVVSLFAAFFWLLEKCLRLASGEQWKARETETETRVSRKQVASVCGRLSLASSVGEQSGGKMSREAKRRAARRPERRKRRREIGLVCCLFDCVRLEKCCSCCSCCCSCPPSRSLSLCLFLPVCPSVCLSV